MEKNVKILICTENAEERKKLTQSLASHGFSLTEVSFDFHNSPYFDGFTTEYEDKFKVIANDVRMDIRCCMSFVPYQNVAKVVSMTGTPSNQFTFIVA